MAKLTPADFSSVRAEVEAVEKKTRGELVPLVVEDAGNFYGVYYQTALFGIAFAITVGEAWSAARAWPLDANELLFIGAAGALVGGLVGLVPGVARKLIGSERLAKAVHRRALAEFVEHGCANTRERTGILVMVALFEHRIEIVADRGIQAVAVEKEGPEVWNAVTSEFAKSARAGRAVDGLVEVIRKLGEILARHFPPNGTNDNELSDELRTEKK